MMSAKEDDSADRCWEFRLNLRICETLASLRRQQRSGAGRDLQSRPGRFVNGSPCLARHETLLTG